MPRRDAHQAAEADHAAEQLASLTREHLVRLARLYAPAPWIKNAIAFAAARHVLVLGRIDLYDPRAKVLWPASALCVHRPRSLTQIARDALLSVYWAGEAWRCQVSSDGRVHMWNYKGDPNGPPSVVNGDYPWLMDWANDDSIERGLSSLRAGRAASA